MCFETPKVELRIIRDELSDYEWTTRIKPMLLPTFLNLLPLSGIADMAGFAAGSHQSPMTHLRHAAMSVFASPSVA
jgi:hypothetical protein